MTFNPVEKSLYGIINVFRLFKHLCIASHTHIQNNNGDENIRSTNAESNWLTNKTLTAQLYISKNQIQKEK